MNERERVLAVLNGDAPDRTPWYGDLSWWHAARLREGRLPDAIPAGTEGYLAMHRQAGVGIYLYPPFLWHEEYDETVAVSSERQGDLLVSTMRTPVGTVRNAQKDLPDSATSAFVEHYIKEPDDLRVFVYAAEHRKIRPNYDAFAACDAHWAEWGMACALAPVCTSALQSMMTRWAGMQTTLELLYSDHQAEVERALEAVQASDDAIFEIIASGPAKLVVFPENLSGELTGRRLIGRYELPYWRRRIEQLHAADIVVGIHNDGTLRGSLASLIDAGFDVVEAATPAPVGDMTLEEIREAAEGRIIVWGGLPGALFSPLYSDEQFDDFVRNALRTFPPGSGFVLGVADQVPPDADFARICRVRELVEAYG